MLEKMNAFLGKWMPLLTPISVLIGVLLSDILHHVSFLVPWIFAMMTFIGSLTSNLKSVKYTITHPLSLLLTLAILHILTPLWAFGIGHLFFQNDPYTITGLTLAVVIPTGITSVIWVSLYKGNIALTLAIILLDTLLSPFLVPLSMSLFVGETVQLEVWGMMKGLLGMIVLPSIFGMMVNQFSVEKAKKWNHTLSPFSKIGLALVVSINSSVVAPYLRNIDKKFLQVALTVFVIALSGYFFAWILGVVTKRSKEETIAMIYSGGMRNISAGAVLAVSFFPPAVAVPVVIGMLFQQILAALYGYFIKLVYEKPVVGKIKEGKIS
ncbi:bile acid:sodium symporter [Niallia circulans]|jgi:bile acid:Na+ symporter, BASS family|uniref:bile acid:sodium symporter family protein n=1 Tax=Niallia TaxID=2837506 RepID=UPI00077CD4DA|nr:bile acid:sodium symporter family protein [Niallia circulans]MCM2981298.1 bile acid:sodium symporter family protein [Niallia circulans]MDR4316846.1 bile acid:sodium symporter family protein [Niallia circulans]MED3840159.1 bile acid:sodium symporter family protein [Niallia circulans]MED4241847.1 bile acid:sodium symporter family protein [Niallia circulans]MED4250203.1 bile acid:sodium symporter family protein [Niallia circulans]